MLLKNIAKLKWGYIWNYINEALVRVHQQLVFCFQSMQLACCIGCMHPTEYFEVW